ncbi:EXS family-domain-containing protein [Gamsiella multidivaricata]|uniref:EXS family-domain-containing protein n=1 Tax=Gamsiella multidivaricata TaxID=101098 RepID=UPI00221EA48E|nr:EXS family-domain-containing protein [Gamsiella multidivaricata]KAI7831540.1 EXS family-domain-containing protein [Gamsiella multidivaricata]
MDIGNIFEEWDFSGTVPLPYRVLLMGCIGMFAWASNLHLLSQLRVDVSNLLFSSPPLSGVYTNHPRHSRDKFVNKSTPLSALCRSIYSLGMLFLVVVLINMWMYKWVVAGSEGKDQRSNGGKVPTATDIKGGMGSMGNPRVGIMVPIFGYLTIFVLVFLPLNVMFKKERYRFLRSMKKALFSGLKSDVSFADVILADILTSFARVFGDLTVALCLMFLDRDGSNADACYGSIMVPIMTSIPYCIRLRQCLSEYIESNYTTERHLMNALKYATAFPVIIVSAMQKTSKAASLKGLPYDGYLSDNSLFRLWLFFVALNSFYSFYWDIYHDWSLIQTNPAGRIPTLTISTSPFATTSDAMSPHARPSSGPLSPATPKSGSFAMNDLSRASNDSAGANNSNSNSNNISGNGKALLGSPPNSGNNTSLANGSINNSSNNNSINNISNIFGIFKKPRRFGMRSFLHYEDPLFYIMAVVLDFLLRTTWMLKLVSNIQIEEYEGGVFTMECLEVLRRWIWVLFRLESEMVKRAGYMDTNSAPLSAAGPAGGAAGELSMAEDSSNAIMMENIESWQT